MNKNEIIRSPVGLFYIKMSKQELFWWGKFQRCFPIISNRRTRIHLAGDDRRPKHGLSVFWKTPLQLVTEHFKSVWPITCYLPRYWLRELSNPSVPLSAANAKVLESRPCLPRSASGVIGSSQSDTSQHTTVRTLPQRRGETATPTWVNPFKGATLSLQHSYRLLNHEMLYKKK